MKTLLLSIRKLKKSSTATLLGIAGLITGLVCVMYIFFWVNDELSYDRFHKNIDRIFVVHAYLEGGNKPVTFNGCPPAVGTAIKAEYPEVENSCRYIPAYSQNLVSAQGKKNKIGVAFSDQSLFDIFTLPFIYGNQGKPNDPNQIVLTRSVAAGYFGNTDPVGKMVRFNNVKDLVVSGVIDDLPHNSTLQFDAVIPLENLGMYYGRADFLSTWYNNSFTTFGLLTDRSGYEKIASTITRRIQKEKPQSTNYLRTYLFENGHLYERKHIQNVRIFSLIALMVLLAATLNFINLMTARSVKQAKETGLRKSIGATRGQVIKLIYTDVTIFCLMAFLIAFLISICGLPLFNQMIGKQIEYSTFFQVKPMLVFLVIFLITTFLAGSYPAFFLSSFKITQTLNANVIPVKGRGLFRNALMIAIFMISITLLASTLIISRQTRFLSQLDMGYNQEQLLYLKLEGQLKNKRNILKEELKRTPEIHSATTSSFLPVRVGNNGEGWSWEGKDPEFKPLVTDWATDEDLIQTLEARIIEGQFFNNEIQGIVINKAFAEVIGWDSFTGKTLSSYGDTYTIAGVIDNIKYNDLAESCRPMAIHPVSDWDANTMMIRISPEQMDKTIRTIKQISEKLEPDFPVQYGFVDDELARLYDSETKLRKLTGVFSALSMIVLALGILGVIMFLAEQKTKEIGVRKCLGEQVDSIVFRLIKPILVSGLIATVIAVPATWYVMDRWLQHYTERIQLSIWYFTASFGLSIMLALVMVSWQSWRAATRNPVESLRHE